MDGSVSAFLNHLQDRASGVEPYAPVVRARSRLVLPLSERGAGRGSRPDGRSIRTAASLFGLADRAGLCREHRGPPSGQSALVLSVSPEARVGRLRPVGRSS